MGRVGDSHYTAAYHIKLTKIVKFQYPPIRLYDYGLEDKDFYRIEDVCRLLGITTFTFRSHLYAGIYLDDFKRDGLGRIFTIEDIMKFRDGLAIS